MNSGDSFEAVCERASKQAPGRDEKPATSPKKANAQGVEATPPTQDAVGHTQVAGTNPEAAPSAGANAGAESDASADDPQAENFEAGATDADGGMELILSAFSSALPQPELETGQEPAVSSPAMLRPQPACPPVGVEPGAAKTGIAPSDKKSAEAAPVAPEGMPRAPGVLPDNAKPGNTPVADAPADSRPSVPADPTAHASAESAAGETPKVATEASAVEQALAAKTSARPAKSSAGQSVVNDGVSSEKEKTFVSVDGKRVAELNADHGTSSAKELDEMKTARQLRQRFQGTVTNSTPVAGNSFEGVEALSVSWKGWNSGSGDRTATSAQSSRLGDQSAAHGTPLFSAPGFGANRTSTVASPAYVPPAAATVPSNGSELMAPVGAAIERLLSRGQDHLALTVRFENGGSLALKLTMRDGEIASQFQTDDPGLENALRTSWGQFAQDSQGRGWRLASPTFSSATSQHEQPDGNRDGRASHREAFESNSGHYRSHLSNASRRSQSAAGAVNIVQGNTTSLTQESRGWTIWA